ncbi:VOC family protein [Aliiroseovarius sp.]|uniref:VOC family protein n=1 Tax=Aliiroseovarius sp. TaxID=1872442 RepID=UPI0026059D47|nr:VOC family protein [Aliiroseovarius sp.]
MSLAELDHIVISAATLDEGAAMVERTLGVPMAGGGQHVRTGTHNRLLSLGPDCYLEVIAVDPQAAGPDLPRMFDLDYFTGDARLTNWVVRVNSLTEALHRAPVGTGDEQALGRDGMRWQMAIPPRGNYPFGGAFPGLIEWRGKRASEVLPDSGCRLTRVVITHPEATALEVALHPFLADARVTLSEAPEITLQAEIDTPTGRKVLR